MGAIAIVVGVLAMGAFLMWRNSRPADMVVPPTAGGSYQHCPQCGDEFQAWVTECPDCRVPLGSTPAPASAAPIVSSLPPLTELAAIAQGDPWELRALAEQLLDEGVSSLVEAYPPPGGSADTAAAPRGHGTDLALYVEPTRAQRAADLVAAYRAERAGNFAASDAPGTEYSTCPGCDDPIADDAAECPSCGLVFPEVELACIQCGARGITLGEPCPECRADTGPPSP